MSTPGFQPVDAEGNAWDEERSQRMHRLKNRPPTPEIDGEPLTFPPYRFQPYPVAMYHAEKEAIVVGSMQNPDGSARQVADLKAEGWTESADPEEQRKALAAYVDQTYFIPAAERAFDDQHMSEKAKAEFLEADRANGDVPLVDLPNDKPLNKSRGRVTAAKG